MEVETENFEGREHSLYKDIEAATFQEMKGLKDPRHVFLTGEIRTVFIFR